MTYTDDLGRTQAATVLVQHSSIPAYPPTNPTSYRCPSCSDTEIAGPNSPSHARHQAEALADAGLLRKPFDLTRVEVDQRLGYPPHVRIDQAGIMIVNGYVMPDAGISRVELSLLGRHERSTRTPPEHYPDRPLEERLQALAADLEREAPFTAQILRNFAADAARLSEAGAVYEVDEICANLPAVVQAHAERERRVRDLANEWDGSDGMIDREIAARRLHEALGDA